MSTGVGSRQSGVGSLPGVDRGSRIAGRRASRRGQTTTEYLMIAGIMTAIGILILLWMFQPWRETVEDVADCVRTDDCEPVGAQ
ncbi:hypothetical protein TBR22_A03160 [Luteitalea sp. TBR-22]|uniref:hypothetical protein n=1 Tax=Luteitalea sp. TBR-22 TaxID=2802971 RepID=UPI001AF82398|nr:hypothetical protein [Luteitalea sp. TBR-22]BCS31116.1 hypothetical protein TBR22_A03160 [Luteitalea sp. TBR-22]